MVVALIPTASHFGLLLSFLCYSWCCLQVQAQQQLIGDQASKLDAYAQLLHGLSTLFLSDLELLVWRLQLGSGLGFRCVPSESG